MTPTNKLRLYYLSTIPFLFGIVLFTLHVINWRWSIKPFDEQEDIVFWFLIIAPAVSLLLKTILRIRCQNRLCRVITKVQIVSFIYCAFSFTMAKFFFPGQH